MPNTGYGMSGWKEFHRNRKNILEEMDKVLEQISNRPVKTAHGDAVEAYIRKWLAEFLPKKFSVTSGYIIPNIYNDKGKLFHFDLIIYDSLNSPVLWVEGNEDNSELGKFRAIPAKHVVAVYEVKSKLSVKTVNDALDKIQQLSDIRGYLPDIFTSAALFVDLPKDDVNNRSIMKALLKGANVPHFWGGAVLRCKVDDSATGVIQYANSIPELDEKEIAQQPILAPIDSIKVLVTEDGSSATMPSGTHGTLLFTYDGKSWCVSKVYTATCQNETAQVYINWSRGGFAEFAMEMLGRIEGQSLDDKDRAVFGRVFDDLEVQKAEFQPRNSQSDLPFINIDIEPLEDNENVLDVKALDEGTQFSFVLTAENIGQHVVEVGDDSLKHFTELPVGKKAKMTQTVLAQSKGNNPTKVNEELSQIISGKLPLKFGKRLVYRFKQPDGSTKLLCTAKKFSVYKDRVESEEVHSYDELKNS